MPKYLVVLKGSTSLTKANEAIAGEEATGAKFVKSTLTYYHDALTNLVEFEDLPAGQVPDDCVLQPFNAAAPAGKQMVWNGAMLLGGSTQAVKLYR